MGGAAPKRCRSAVCSGRRYRRSCRGRGLHAERRSSGRGGADAGGGARNRRSVRRRAPRRTAVRETQARPRRSGGARAARTVAKGPATMSDPENFLTRWSRRKREAADDSDRTPSDEQRQRTPDAPSVERAAIDPSPPPPSDAASAPAEPAFDLTKLPPIESITAETDIRAFLAPGVPADLRLAALRRAWASDPKVRDFVGLNDYDFDFHTPGAIPGFGPLTMTNELRQEVARIVGGLQPAAEPPAATPAVEHSGAPPQPSATPEKSDVHDASTDATATSESSGHNDHAAQDQDELIPAQPTPHRSKDPAAPQQERPKVENLQTVARRGHGRAL